MVEVLGNSIKSALLCGQFIVDEATMEINVSLRCVPVKGKANRELINTIFKAFWYKTFKY
jgi:uncharacterized protein YggU (UPF0235/DUF167 family)